MVRTRLNIGCRYSTPVRERPLHPTRGPLHARAVADTSPRYSRDRAGATRRWKLNNTDRRGNPLIWLDCGGQQSVLDNKPGCTRWRARSGSRHGRRERDLAGGVGAARPVSIAVSMTFPMRSAAASTSRSLTWA